MTPERPLRRLRALRLGTKSSLRIACSTRSRVSSRTKADPVTTFDTVFAETPAVASFLELTGEEGLPVTLVDGQVVLTGRYPSRAELIRYAGLALPKAPGSDGTEVEPSDVEPSKAGVIKGIVKSGCCSGSSGCC